MYTFLDGVLDDLPKLKVTTEANSKSATDQSTVTIPIDIKNSINMFQIIFDICSSSMQYSNVNLRQLNTAVALIQEFNYCGGLVILNQIISRLFQCQDNHMESEVLNCVKTLLLSFRNLLESVKFAKAEYSHNIMRIKHNHKHCNSKDLLSLHHDVLGEMNYMHDDVVDTAEKENLCVVASTFKFLSKFVEHSVTLSPQLTHLILLTIDRIGICTCMSPTAILVPLLLPFFCYHDVKSPLAVLTRLLLQYNASNDSSLHNQNGDTSIVKR